MLARLAVIVDNELSSALTFFRLATVRGKTTVISTSAAAVTHTFRVNYSISNDISCPGLKFSAAVISHARTARVPPQVV